MDNKVFETFVTLGKKLKENSLRIPYLSALKNNSWFVEDSIKKSIKGICYYLEEQTLSDWAGKYSKPKKQRKVGLVTAGNIPLVGFHDILCILLTGHQLNIQISSKDAIMTKWILDKLIKLSPSLGKRIFISKSLAGCDAYVATGSDNTSRYFEYAFRGKPSLIRTNRTSIAILSGEESREDLRELFEDIFTYFGLGCRNISFLLLPEGYKIQNLKKYVSPHLWRAEIPGFADNYRYNKALMKLSGERGYDWKCMMVKQTQQIHSPVSMLHFDHYHSISQVESFIDQNANSIQCIVNGGTFGLPQTAFGSSQLPKLEDYQDGIDTMKFLSSL